MMKRREFCEKFAGAAMGAGIASSAAPGIAAAQAARAPRKNTLMHVGGDYHSVAGPGITSRENLEYNLRYGVKHLTVSVRKRSQGGGWDLDELKRMKDDCDKYGVTFEAIRMDADYITLRKGPERDRELDNIIGNIQKASQVGVKVITYHWTVIPIRRNKQTPGRGKVTYNAFRLEDNWKDLPVGKSGKVSSEDYWERITYFLGKVIHDFAEVYPDEGEVDFFKVMRILRDVQFAGSICPDHMPRHPDDPGSLQSFAFGYGYIKALIQAANSEVPG